MKPVIFHPEAEVELEHEVDYYEQRSAGLGNELRIEIETAVGDILLNLIVYAKFPGTPCRVKVLHRYPFSVIFEDRPHALTIYALAHHRRKPGYWKSRLNKSS